MVSPERIGLRDSVPADFDFLFALHAATIKEYVELTWGWDEAAQVQRYRDTFEPGDTRIVTLDGTDIGMMAVEEREAETFLALIEIAPRHQHQGIGTALICKLMAEAAEKGKSVGLQVLKVNPAKALYDQLGFKVIGETEAHYIMRSTGPAEGIACDSSKS